MQSEAFWVWVYRLSERVILKYAQEGVTIPLDSSDDPLKVFEATDVSKNPLRFAVFILWLKHQPQAFEWFEVIREHHNDLVHDTVIKLKLKEIQIDGKWAQRIS